MDNRVLAKLEKILGKDNIFVSQPELEAYASDASIYRGSPLAVLAPLNSRQLKLAVEQLVDNNLPFTARGGGSGLAGGAVSDGIIIDFSRIANILELDLKNRTVSTECGIVYDHLNHYLAPYGLFFPPDPSSGDTCQIGGMLGNNSSGARSVKYGTTRKYVEELEVLLADGSIVHAKDFPLESDELQNLFEKYPALKKIYTLIKDNRALILKAYPDLKKNVCGYDLKAVVEKLDQGLFALPQLLVGSEGTLGMFISAKLRLLPLPQSKLTSLILFEKLDQVADATIDFLNLAPSGLELIDGNTLDLIGREQFNLPVEAEAMLIVEFDNPPYEQTVAKLKQYLHKYKLCGLPIYETDPKKQAALWAARKAIVPTLYRLDKNARPWGFIEDAAVPSARMPEFIRFLNALFEKHNLTCGIFGHIGDGNLHVRPALNLSTEKGQKLAREIYDQVYEKIFSLGGSATAEHGDGHLRTEVIRHMYGDKIYELFLQIKNLLDPRNLSNPDVLLSERGFTENIDTEKVMRECAACGKCNTYCPSYEVYKSEHMAARGWVRIMLSRDYDYKKSQKELDGCLNCKSCFVVCPAGVDVSRYVTRRRSENQSKWGKRIFSVMEKSDIFEALVRFNGKILRACENPILRPWIQVLGSPVTDIPSDRILPSIARQTLRQRYQNFTDVNRGEVAYFYGCADNLLESGAGPALIELLEFHGHKVVLPEQKCCGMPQQTYGFFEFEKAHAKFNLESLARFKYIVCSCATCLGQLLSYVHLFKSDDKYYQMAKAVAAKCYDISEFIFKFVDLKFKNNGMPKTRAVFHQPCHLREAGRQDIAENLLKHLPSTELVPMQDAAFCCGSAGTYSIFHYQNSMKIFERKKIAVQKSHPDIVLTNCPTCILQFQDGLKSRTIARHSVEHVARLCGLELE